ncbi:MAG TPA: HutR like protein, partial [Vibrio sp.]|nr:HutR like protein [Vibrio sp.]
GAGDIRSYVWSNTSLLETQEVFTFDVRNAEIIAYAPTAIAGSVLLVAED